MNTDHLFDLIAAARQFHCESPEVRAIEGVCLLAEAQGLDWPYQVSDEIRLRDSTDISTFDCAFLHGLLVDWMRRPENEATANSFGGASPSMQHVSASGRLRWEVEVDSTGRPKIVLQIWRPVRWALRGAAVPVIQVVVVNEHQGRDEYEWRVCGIDYGDSSMIAPRHVRPLFALLCALVDLDEAEAAVSQIPVGLTDEE